MKPERESINPLDIQIGGSHYKNMKIQPCEFIHGNGLGFLEGCVIERLCRYDQPTGKGMEDLQKCIHELQLLIHLKYGDGSPGNVQGGPGCGPVSYVTAALEKISGGQELHARNDSMGAFKVIATTTNGCGDEFAFLKRSKA